VDSGFGNSIYWTLPVVTTIIHFTSHKPETCLLSPVSLQTSYLICLPVSLNHAFTLSVSVSVSSTCILLACNLPLTPLRQFFPDSVENTLSNSWVVMQTMSCCYENNCLPSRYDGNASVRCLRSVSSIPAFRHFVTQLP
jgi:hypothetical protein